MSGALTANDLHYACEHICLSGIAILVGVIEWRAGKGFGLVRLGICRVS